MFNEARGVSNFICDSPGLPLTLQKQLCHSLIQSDLFPSLNSSWPSYWSLLQPSSPHFLLFVPFLIFICIFCSPPFFCWLMVSPFILLLIFFPCRSALSWCFSFVCTLTVPPSTLCIWTFLTHLIKRLLVISTSSNLFFRLAPFALHPPNNHVFFNLFFGAWDKNGVRPVLEGFQTLWLQRDLAWAGECDDGNPVEENILSKQACGITVSQSGLKGKLFHLYILIFQLRQFGIFTRLGGSPQGLDFFFSLFHSQYKV